MHDKIVEIYFALNVYVPTMYVLSSSLRVVKIFGCLDDTQCIPSLPFNRIIEFSDAGGGRINYK